MSETEIQYIPIENALKNDENWPVIDVRTPAEFEKGHLPGAVNLPLFSNAERAEIGTVYKKKSREEAILLGFDFTGPKWSGFIKDALETAPDKKAVLYCWRGGMRSGAMAWALNFYGFDVRVIEGGYKSFRNYVHRTFEKEVPLLVLGGMTGSHKTEILNGLAAAGEQMIDLEALAEHHGSTYGSMGKAEQPPQEKFENRLALTLQKFDITRRIWVEDESAAIGKIRVPAALWRQMQQAPVIELRMERQERIRFLAADYGRLKNSFLIEATQKISKRLGLERTKEAVSAIQENRMEDFVGNVLRYYDKAYQRCLARRNPESIFPLTLEPDSLPGYVEQVLGYSEHVPDAAR